MSQHETFLSELRQFFAGGSMPHHSEEAAGRFAALQLKALEIVIMQLAELKSLANTTTDKMSGLEADVGALVARAGQASGSTTPSGGGLSTSDQAVVDDIGATITGLGARIDTLRSQVVGIDASGASVAPPSTPNTPMTTSTPTPTPDTTPASPPMASTPAATPVQPQ